MRFHKVRFLFSYCLPILLISSQIIQGQQVPEDAEFNADNKYFDSKTEALVLEGNAYIRYGLFYLSADTIRFDQESSIVDAKGNVILTRQELRLVADSVVHDIGKQFATIQNFRAGNGRVYVSGALLEGDPENFRFVDANFFAGEPGTYLFKASAEEISLVDQNVVKGRKLSLKLGPVPFFIIPSITHPLDAETNLFKADLDYSGHIGGAVGGEFRFPFKSGIRAGANLALTTKRGVLFGPAAEYDIEKDGQTIIGAFTSGYINDDSAETGNDINGTPIDDDRFFAEWNHIQRWANDRASISGYARYWSDSEVTRDFYDRSFDTMQDPDSFIEAAYAADNWRVSLLARASPNDFQSHTERLPELRFDLFPTRIIDDVSHSGSLSIAKLENKDDSLLGELNQADRIDAYYGFRYNKTLTPGVVFQTKAGARAIHYFEGVTTTIGSTDLGLPSDLYIEADEGTRIFGDFGADLKATAYAQFEYKNETWNIDGLRHVFEPVLSVRYQPAIENDPVFALLDYSVPNTFLSPIDLEDRRDIDLINEEKKIRLEFRNRLQTRAEDGGSRDLIRFDVALDHFLEIGTLDDRYSALVFDTEITPAPWLELRSYARYDVEGAGLREQNTRIVFRDTDYWSIGFGNHFLDQVVNIEQFYAFGEYSLNENLKLYASARFDEISDTFYEQRIGIMQRALDRYGIKYELRIYDGSRRESDFGISIGVDLFDNVVR